MFHLSTFHFRSGEVDCSACAKGTFGDGETIISQGEAGDAWEVVVHRNRAYVADNTLGIAVVDLTDPAHPVRVDHGCWTSLSGLSLWIAVIAFSAKDSRCSFMHQLAVSLGNE